MRYFLGFFVLFGLVTPAGAAEIAPSLKSAPANISEILTDLEFQHFKQAMRDIDAKQWTDVREHRKHIHQSAAAQLLDWKIALYDPATNYSELQKAVHSLKDWPRYTRIRILAEQKISGAGIGNTAILKWFTQYPPLSGAGKIAHSDALFTAKQTKQAQIVLQDAWHNHFLPKKISKAVLKKRKKQLNRANHEARVNMLLWAHNAEAAQRLLSRTSRDFRLLSNARISLMRRSRGVDGTINAVPKTMQTHLGLLYERALWRRKAGRTGEAKPLVLAFGKHTATKAGTKRLWTERHIHARRAIKNKQYKTAYQLAAAHGFKRGSNFAEGEWLSGWLALRKLGKPALAKAHFETLAANVKTPVSRARAQYWLGLSLQELGQQNAANVAFINAAQHNFTYYGQLAQEEIGPGYITLGKDPEPDAAARAIFDAHPQIQALKLLAKIGETSLYRQFSYHLDDVLPGAVDHVMLARLNRKNAQAGIAIRAAKAAMMRGEILPESQWPLIDLPNDTHAPEPALILALSRQESELYPHAISRVGARGLMQLMPRTAETTAKHLDTPYRQNWLVDDPQYNLTLGAAHLQELLDEFSGSYILSVAAYNAGARRAKQWIKEYGDPRGEADPVEWIESIPFSETRNYVQRVLENIQVYRNRLSGQPTLIRLRKDLNRGT